MITDCLCAGMVLLLQAIYLVCLSVYFAYLEAGKGRPN